MTRAVLLIGGLDPAGRAGLGIVIRMVGSIAFMAVTNC